MGPKRRKARSTVQTAAAAAKERDQDTARLINEALEDGVVSLGGGQGKNSSSSSCRLVSEVP
jgi:hypothetical protein